jgi:hypothetical protein
LLVVELAHSALSLFRLGEFDDTAKEGESVRPKERERRRETHPQPFDIPLGRSMISAKTTFPAVVWRGRDKEGWSRREERGWREGWKRVGGGGNSAAMIHPPNPNMHK